MAYANPRTWQQLIELLEKLTGLILSIPTPPEEEIADYLGRIQNIERKLGDHRRGLYPETPAVTGAEYRTVEERVAKRSFGTAAIIDTVATRTERDHLAVILDLIREGAAKLTFGWTPLKRYFQTHQLPMRIEHVEIEDLGDVDGPHVGETYTTRTRIVGVKGDKKEDE